MRKILIVGGGSAGWMTAALFGKLFQGLYDVELVESEAIGIVGVGEATIPAIKKYNDLIQLDEVEFMKRTQATFKLGVQFVDWWKKGHSYIHGFGVIGQDWEWLRCHHYWLQARARGRARDFADYSINTAAALHDKFMRARADMAESPIGHIAHAFHFDAGLYAKHLSTYAQARGVKRREGKIVDVPLRPEDGFVRSVTMNDGEVIAADFFVDCSGFRGLIIEQALKTGYEDWTHWLPCDRAIAVPSERSEHFTPYTRSTAHDAGWQWRIPLQHRVGNGIVYCSRYLDHDTALERLLRNIEGETLVQPNKLRFVTGVRRKQWHRNCIAIGLSGGFMEPLESTSIHLIQRAVLRLIRMLPLAEVSPRDVAEFNDQQFQDMLQIRDFLFLHYKATNRGDSPFWRQCRDMEVPATLQRKIDLFAANGRVFREDDELFTEESWIQVFLGQGVIPRGYDPLVDIKSDEQVAQFLGNIETVIRKCVAVMPSHADYVAQTCRA